MKIKPKLYLHAGCGKTGTTAIQCFLHDNKNILFDKGFLYPETGLDEDASHHQLAIVLCDINMHNTNKLKTISKESILKKLEREVAECEYVLISSELFAQQWNKLPNSFINMWSEIYIIFYIRDRCDLAESLYNQWVKESIETCPYINEVHHIPRYYNYTNFLRGYSGRFGMDHMIVRRYGASYFKNGSIYDDFVSIMGIPSISGFKIPHKKENIKLSLESLEIIRLINSLCISKKTREKLKHYAKTFNTKPTYSFNLISKNLRTEINEYFAEEDEFILNNFFASDVCLFKNNEIMKISGYERLDKRIYSCYFDYLYTKDKNIILELLYALMCNVPRIESDYLDSRKIFLPLVQKFLNIDKNMINHFVAKIIDFLIIDYNNAMDYFSLNNELLLVEEQNKLCINFKSIGYDPQLYFKIPFSRIGNGCLYKIEVLIRSSIDSEIECFYSVSGLGFVKEKSISCGLKKEINDISFFIIDADFDGHMRIDFAKSVGEFDLIRIAVSQITIKFK